MLSQRSADKENITLNASILQGYSLIFHSMIKKIKFIHSFLDKISLFKNNVVHNKCYHLKQK